MGKTASELTRHIRYRHTKEKKFKCSLCKYTSCESSKVRRHFKGKHRISDPQKCEICGTFTPDKKALEEHKKFHIEKTTVEAEKTCICEYCNLRIDTDDLSTHLRLQHRTEI